MAFGGVEVFRMFGTLAMEGVDKVESQMKGLSSKLQGWGQNLTSIGGKLSMGLTLPILGAGTAAYKMSGDLDTVLRQVNVMLGGTEEDLAEMRDNILKMSSETGKSAVELGQSLFGVVSAGHRGADMYKILETTARGAVGGNADLIATTGALTKAMDIFRLKGVEGSQRAMDTFFGIVDTGLLTFEEMAIAFPRATASAAGLGISIEESGAALGVLTKVSGSTEEAATALNGVFMQLIKPSEDMQTLYEEWGVKNGPQAIERFGGLKGVLDKVLEATGGNVDELAKLFPNVRAIRAALPLVTTNAEDFASAIETVTNSTGKTNKAFDEMSKSKGVALQKMIQTLKNALIKLGDTIGPYITPLIEKIGQKIGEFVSWFQSLDPRWQKIILGIVAALAAVGPVLMVIGTAMIFLNAVMAASPVTWIVLGIVAALAALIAIGILVWKNWDKIKQFFINLWDKVKNAFKTAWEWIKNMFLNYTPYGLIIQHWDKIKQFFVDLWDKVKQIFINVWEGIKNIFFNYTPYGLVISHWEEIVSWFQDMWARVKEAFVVAGEAIWNWMLDWIPGLNIIVENWDLIVEAFRAGWDKIKDFFVTIGTAVKDFFVNQFNIMRNVAVTIWTAISNFFKKVWNGIYEFFKSKIDAIRNYFKVRFEAMKQIAVSIWTAVSNFFRQVWETIKGIFEPPILYIKNLIMTAFNWLKDSFIIPVWTSIKDFFSNLWEGIKRSLRAFKDTFIEIWNRIVQGLKGPINKIIGFFNRLIDGVENAINWIVNGLNRIHISVPDWVGKLIPGLAGKEWGINLGKVSFGEIPLLQYGGRILRPGAAIVGDRGPELLSLPRGAEVRPLTETGVTITNVFHIAEMIVREEADIHRVAEELLDMQQTQQRGVGYK
ncbi:MAG: phage tail tape measure protein [Candidatus Heimdallarchaeaceae archaeon]